MGARAAHFRRGARQRTGRRLKAGGRREKIKKKQTAIIGFGKGGKTLAGALAAAGQRVILIERSEKMYGGTCINVACIPSKSLHHSAGLSAAHGREVLRKRQPLRRGR